MNLFTLKFSNDLIIGIQHTHKQKYDKHGTAYFKKSFNLDKIDELPSSGSFNLMFMHYGCKCNYDYEWDSDGWKQFTEQNNFAIQLEIIDKKIKTLVIRMNDIKTRPMPKKVDKSTLLQI